VRIIVRSKYIKTIIPDGAKAKKTFTTEHTDVKKTAYVFPRFRLLLSPALTLSSVAAI
jgi:hypothetical protein